MNISFERYQDHLIVFLRGELDHHTAKGIGEKIDMEILLKKPKSVCIDFENLSFMDSSGLAVVLGRRKACQTQAIPLSISGLSGSIEKVFAMSGIQKYVRVKENCYEI